MSNTHTPEQEALRFLIVDDSRAIQAITRRVVERCGYPKIQIETAANGELALEVLKNFSPHLIITDWHMPKMSGRELLQTIRQLNLSDAHVGLVTTEPSQSMLDEARRNGARFVINKPFKDDELIQALLDAVPLDTLEKAPPTPAKAEKADKTGGTLVVTALGVALAYALRRRVSAPPLLHASGAQVAFRFNSYVALAVVERVAGAPGVAAIALVIALAVPLCNVAAVWPLARHGGHRFGRELARNPLIVATVAGLLFNLFGWRLPELAATTLGRIGTAALPIGLMAVGAGLRLGALREGPALAAGLLAIRHAVLPLAALAWVWATDLPPAEQLVLVIFAALPTASSGYVLAVRMGGHGPYVAGLVTVSTLLGMASLPLALAAWSALTALPALR
jgi:predicted permease/CheY-like chemotaxis protein